MFTKEEFLSTKFLCSMVKLRIERNEYREALQFIKDCVNYENITEVYDVFKTIKDSVN